MHETSRRISATLAWALRLAFLVASAGLIATPAPAQDPTNPATTTNHSGSPFLVILGIAQDAGIPQAGSHGHPAWRDPDLRRSATCLGLIDPESNRRWLFEATPDMRQQFFVLDTVARQRVAVAQHELPQLDGIFLTHAHIGHYTGLMFLGHESMGARRIAVYAMPRMCRFLQNNGPWSQLVSYENIELVKIEAAQPVVLNERLQVTALLVPHRQEFSEVVGYRIQGPQRAVLFIPDIDSWAELDALGVAIEAWIASVDAAYLDGTFYANGEIPGRDMSGFPHPFITTSMRRFARLPAEERTKVHFIHFNHTNAAAREGSAEQEAIEDAGFHVAREGDRVEL